jgi:hypothetical protein
MRQASRKHAAVALKNRAPFASERACVRRGMMYSETYGIQGSARGIGWTRGLTTYYFRRNTVRKGQENACSRGENAHGAGAMLPKGI